MCLEQRRQSIPVVSTMAWHMCARAADLSYVTAVASTTGLLPNFTPSRCLQFSHCRPEPNNKIAILERGRARIARRAIPQHSTHDWARSRPVTHELHPASPLPPSSLLFGNVHQIQPCNYGSSIHIASGARPDESPLSPLGRIG